MGYLPQVVANLKQPLMNQLTDAKILAQKNNSSSTSTSTASATQAEILKAAGQIAQVSLATVTIPSTSLSLTGNKRLLYEYIQANNTRLNLNLNLDDVAAILSSSLETAIPDLMSLPNLSDKTIYSTFLLNGFTKSSILGMLSTSQVPTKGISFYNVDGYARQQMNSTVEQLYSSAVSAARVQAQVGSYVSSISASTTPVIPVNVSDYNAQVAWYDQQITAKQQEAQTFTVKAQSLNAEIANLTSQVSTNQIDLSKLIAYNSSSNAFLAGPAIPSNVQVFYKTANSSTIYGMFADGSVKAYTDKNQFMQDGGKSDFSNVQVLTQSQITQKQNDYMAQFKALGAITDQKIAAKKSQNQIEISRLNALIASINLTLEQKKKDKEAAEAAKVKAEQDEIALQNKKLTLVKPIQSTSTPTVSFTDLQTASNNGLKPLPVATQSFVDSAFNQIKSKLTQNAAAQFYWAFANAYGNDVITLGINTDITPTTDAAYYGNLFGHLVATGQGIYEAYQAVQAVAAVWAASGFAEVFSGGSATLAVAAVDTAALTLGAAVVAHGTASASVAAKNVQLRLSEGPPSAKLKGPVYRGGDDLFSNWNIDVILQKNGIYIDRAKSGISVNIDPKSPKVLKYAGPNGDKIFKITDLPEGLEVVQQGNNPTHYLIRPNNDFTTPQRFKELLQLINLQKI